MRLIRAGVYCERWQVESWEINMNTSGLEENLGSDVCWVLIHRDGYELMISDVFCFGNFWRYIGNRLYWPIPMYILDRFEPPYIGMGIEILIPMYRLLKPSNVRIMV